VKMMKCQDKTNALNINRLWPSDVKLVKNVLGDQILTLEKNSVRAHEKCDATLIKIFVKSESILSTYPLSKTNGMWKKLQNKSACFSQCL